jgi:hypothetical protein
MSQFLRSPRGGGLPFENIVLLTNEMATTAAIRKGLQGFLKRATKNDTVLLFIATHGVVFPVANKTKGFIVTYDTDPMIRRPAGFRWRTFVVSSKLS